MPSLDGYSLNKKIDDLREEIEEEIITLKRDFCNLYELIDNLDKKVNKPKSKAKKKCEPTESEK